MPPSNGIYVPTLAVRASEMNGMEFLPGASKDRMNPVFLLAPWANSRSLERTIERIERAFYRRQYFLDFDRDYIPTGSDNPSQLEWLELRNPENFFEAWRNFWLEYPLVMPCLQLDGQDDVQMRKQIEFIQEQDREFCLRIELQRMPMNLASIVEVLSTIGTADYTVVIEGGWVEEPLMMYASVHGLIVGILARLDGRIPIVVSCTSMLRGFADIEGLGSESYSNHELLAQLRGNTSRDRLLYGDWGSTRPREISFGQAPFPRIDYATADSWFFARNRGEGWDYQRAAEVMVSSRVWDGELGIWGERMIRDTAVNPQFAIDTAQKNVAARVNIHLHRQALYGEQIRDIDLDDEWID